MLCYRMINVEQVESQLSTSFSSALFVSYFLLICIGYTLKKITEWNNIFLNLFLVLSLYLRHWTM